MAYKLTQLQEDIEARVSSIRDHRPEWPCQRGCDQCCRRLAEIPRLTEAEWQLLREGIEGLPEDQRQHIAENIGRLAENDTRPVVCPFLDQTAGACSAYAYRPIACRTYGFYVQRDKGLYCKDIEGRVEHGEWSDVIWGNHDTIDRQLSELGVSRDLTEWFQLTLEARSKSFPTLRTQNRDQQSA